MPELHELTKEEFDRLDEELVGCPRCYGEGTLQDDTGSSILDENGNEITCPRCGGIETD